MIHKYFNLYFYAFMIFFSIVALEFVTFTWYVVVLEMLSLMIWLYLFIKETEILDAEVEE